MFDELDVVRLVADADLEGEALVAGSEGTVLLVHDAGAAYEVEFMSPRHAIVGVPADLLEAL